MSSGFPDDVVVAIMAHMNGDHLADNLLIVRVLAARPDARSARMSGMDADAIEFEVDGGPAAGGELVRLPWTKRLTERAEVRREVVAMYERAGGSARH